MRKVVVLADKTGDLGNRLFRFARFYNSKPRSIWLCDLSLYQFAYLYSPKRTLTRLLFCLLRLLDNKRYTALVRWLSGRSWVAEINVPEDIQSDAALADFYKFVHDSRERVVMVRGNTLYLRTGEADPETASRLRDIFRLKRKHRKKAARKIGLNRSDGPLVGVHIRRRDYRTFVGGKFYYEDDVYRAVISRLDAGWVGPGTPQFILVCEEPVEAKSFPSSRVVFFGPGSVCFDQALLEACNFIVGPPSTFSGWVSFLHGIPRAEIREAKQCLSWSDFRETPYSYISIEGAVQATESSAKKPVMQHHAVGDKSSTSIGSAG